MRFLILVSVCVFLMVTLLGCSCHPITEFKATVVSIEVNQGGFRSATASVKFSNGHVLPFGLFDASKFKVGHTYHVVCKYSDGADRWQLKSEPIELRE